MKNISGIDRDEFCQWLSEHSIESYRADQILQWIYRRGVSDYALMNNLPGRLRELLAKNFLLRSGSVQKTVSSPDGAIKLLLRWRDGALTETVLMEAGTRRTVCVSSQVGCPVRCVFCASGLDGLQRSLEAGEIVEQVLRAQEQLQEGERISNVVVMGMGEPLANYDETLKAVKIINADWGPAIGARHITISTIGLPDQIRKLADEPLQITLAVSLHAADDELRSELIPWAKKIKLEEIFASIDYYYQQTHREVTLEYVMLEGVNCGNNHADKLARWAKRSRCNVNLINYNTVVETGFKNATKKTITVFMQRLKDNGVNVHLRRSQGGKINAACGQLRRNDEPMTNTRAPL